MDVRMWTPVDQQNGYQITRSLRKLNVDWDQIEFEYLPKYILRSDESKTSRTSKESTESENQEAKHWPVMPFVRPNGHIGLMSMHPSGLGLNAEDFPSDNDSSFSDDDSSIDGDKKDGWDVSSHLSKNNAPWNLSILDQGEDRSLFRVLHTHDLDKKEMVRPRGLFNTHNMCFFNSVLQVLVHTSPLYALIDDIIRNVPLGRSSDGEPVLDAVSHFFYNYRNLGDSRRALSGEGFYDVICSQSKFHVERNRQEDAQEFMSNLLDSLEISFRDAKPTDEDVKDDLLTLKREARNRAKEESNGVSGWTEIGQNSRKVETQHAGHQDKENPIEALFGGRFKSTLVKQGGKPSVTMEPFQQVMLDISEQSVNSVQSAFDRLLHEEVLMLDNIRATKKTEVDQLPPILIVHIKRFTFMQMYGTYEMGKITKPIFIDESLSIIQVNRSTATYKPVGVIYHHGTSATRGHYTADVKVKETWYSIDDEQVVPVDENDVVGHDLSSGGSRSAYMVFYARSA